MGAAETLLWTQRFIAIALIQQTLEMLKLRKCCAEGGIWRWSILQSEFIVFPRFIQRFLSFALSDTHFQYLLFLQLACSTLLLFTSQPMLMLFLFMSASLIAMRFRGTFNGGSDYMTLIILAALTFARSWPRAVGPAIWYIGIQAGLSYFVAGLVKIKEPRWRNGRMLRDFLSLTNYTIPGRIQKLCQIGRTAKTPTSVQLSGNFANSLQSKLPFFLASWVVILFECLFPLAFLSPQVGWVFLFCGFLFHLGNVYLLGLNRFLFVWIAAYPAIYHMSALFSVTH